MVPMPTEAGLRALSEAIASGDGETVIVHGDAGRIRSWVSQLSAEASATVPEPVGANASVAGGDLVAATETYLLDLVTATAKLPEGKLRGDQEFSTFGVDSILIKKLTAQLQDRLGELPVTLFFEYRTVGELARHLADEHAEALREVLGLDRAQEAPDPAQAPGAARTPRAASVAAPAADVLEGGLRHDQAVAIVGIGGRYPGGADLTRFWESLRGGADLITEIPQDRWDNARHLAAERGEPGAITGRWGGFLDDVARFDPVVLRHLPR
ncbi:beta-ketoacyl synthase N-terminal-like domain-containing protein [Streptomyces sp. S1A(2023)]